MNRAEALERLAGAAWLEAARPFFKCLDGKDGRTRAVGGIVRDTLLGIERTRTDIDLATELVPEEVMARAGAAGLKAHPTGIAHGTVTLVHRGLAAEVTTLRRDVETFGRRAEVRFGAGWEEDARRRDFTMNALYCGMDGELFDPLGGLADCLIGRVRFIGDADARIAEDRLRVYRYFRFAASHGGQRFEEEALAACKRAAGMLDTLSAERVGSEMMRILGLGRCAATVRAMRETGVLARELFPGPVLDALDRLEDFPVPPDATERLAAPVALGAASASDFRAAWRLSNAERDGIALCAVAAGLAGEERWAELAYRFAAYKERAVAVAWAIGEKSQGWGRAALDAVRGLAPPAFPLSGADLIAAGMARGPGLGAALKRLEDEWIASGFEMDRQALLERARLPE